MIAKPKHVKARMRRHFGFNALETERHRARVPKARELRPYRMVDQHNKRPKLNLAFRLDRLQRLARKITRLFRKH